MPGLTGIEGKEGMAGGRTGPGFPGTEPPPDEPEPEPEAEPEPEPDPGRHDSHRAPEDPELPDPERPDPELPDPERPGPEPDAPGEAGDPEPPARVLGPYPLLSLPGLGLVLRFWACPRTTPGPPGTVTSGRGLPVPAEADGAGGTRTGPVEAGGMNGTSIAPGRSSSSSLEPAVMAARVGREARPTSMATMST